VKVCAKGKLGFVQWMFVLIKN